MRKKNGFGKDYSGKPGSTANQSDIWPFNKTLWNLLFRKFLMSFNKSPDTPDDFN